VQSLSQQLFRPEFMSLVLLGKVDGLSVDQTYLDI
jgi:hypothetical protein